MTPPPTWKLKVKQLDRWDDFRTMLGWCWEWEVRKWWEPSPLSEGSYYPADMFGWHGRARSRQKARVYAEGAYKRMVSPKPQLWQESWYHDD